MSHNGYGLLPSPLSSPLPPPLSPPFLSPSPLCPLLSTTPLPPPLLAPYLTPYGDRRPVGRRGVSTRFCRTLLPFGSSSTTCVPLRRRCRRSALLSDARSSPSLSRRPFVTHSSSLFLPARPSSPSRLARQPPPPGGEGGSSPLWLCVSSAPGGRQSARVFAIGVILDPILVGSFS